MINYHNKNDCSVTTQGVSVQIPPSSDINKTTIRVALDKDSSTIATLHTASWRETYRGMLPDEFLEGPVVNERLIFWIDRLKSPNSNQLVLLAEEKNVQIGFICILLKMDAQWGTMIDNLHVRTDEKGKGIDTKLMEEATKWILSNSSDEGVWLWAYEKNTLARKYYERLGGKPVETSMLPSTAGNSVRSIRYAWESPYQLLENITYAKKIRAHKI